MLIKPEYLPMVRTLSMNDAHFDSMSLMNKLFMALDHDNTEGINDTINELLTHTEEHFKDEESMMVEKRFPPYLAHKEEHDEVMTQMYEEASRFRETEDRHVLKNYLESNLAPWFLRHTETMDAVDVDVFGKTVKSILLFGND